LRYKQIEVINVYARAVTDLSSFSSLSVVMEGDMTVKRRRSVILRQAGDSCNSSALSGKLTRGDGGRVKVQVLRNGLLSVAAASWSDLLDKTSCVVHSWKKGSPGRLTCLRTRSAVDNL